MALLIDELEASEALMVVVFESGNPDFFIAHIELLHADEFPKGLGKTAVLGSPSLTV